MSDVPPLHEQEARGLFEEEVQKIVDGVVEDVGAGRLASWSEARAAVAAAAEQSAYAADVEMAGDAVKYGVPAVANTVERQMFEYQVLSLARTLLRTLVEVELGRRPEIEKMPNKT